MAKVTYRKLSQDDPRLLGPFVGPGGYSMERLESIGREAKAKAKAAEAAEESESDDDDHDDEGEAS